MSDLILTNKPYQLVCFIRAGRRPGTRSVDITLLTWIRFDKIKQKFVTKYMPEPYTDERNKYLYKLIQQKQAAPEDWPEYPIQIVGHADTYEIGVERLNILKIKEFACTTDSEIDSTEKIKRIENQIKGSASHISGSEDAFNVPKFSDNNFNTSVPIMPDPLALKDMEGENPGSESSVDSVVEMTNKKRKKSSYRQGREKRFNSTIDNIESEESEEQDLPIVKKISCLKNKSSQLQNPNFQEHKTGCSSTQTFITEAETTPKPRSESHYKASYKPRKGRQNEDLRYMTVLKEIKSLRMDVQRLAEGQKEIKKIMEIDRSAIYVGKKSFEEEYNLKLPFNSLEDFKLLDRELQTNEECCCRFKAALDLSMSLDAGLRKSLNIILKKNLGRDLILMLTAIKKVQGKEVFKNFKFYSCVHAVASAKFIATEEEMISHIGTIFSNAKDWGGNRQARRGNET